MKEELRNAQGSEGDCPEIRPTDLRGYAPRWVLQIIPLLAVVMPLMTFAVPWFEALYRDSGRPLSLPSRYLLTTNGWWRGIGMTRTPGWVLGVPAWLIAMSLL